MKLEISFGSVKDLRDQLDILIEQLSGSYTDQLDLDAIYGGEIPQVAPPIAHENPVVAQQVVEAPKKRTRRTKEQIEAEKTKPVETVPEVEQAIFIAEQPTLPVTVENMVNVLSDMVAENPPIPLAPKNFYSPSEFVSNFVIIVNNLLNNGSLGIGDIEAACKYYDVKLIYMVGKDLSMCEHFYNDLVSRQIITKKGDY